jgi:hypothetical protein
VQALACGFFKEDGSMWPLIVGAGKTQSLSEAVERISRIAATRWLARAKECRRLRGDFLVAGFEIEYSVDGLISEVLFANSRPGSADSYGASKIMTYQDFSKYSFDKLFLKSAENQFGRKITLLKKLSEEFPTLGTLIPNDLFDRLRKIMDVRNIFAHYPIVFILAPRAGKSEVMHC